MRPQGWAMWLLSPESQPLRAQESETEASAEMGSQGSAQSPLDTGGKHPASTAATWWYAAPTRWTGGGAGRPAWGSAGSGPG